jgi:hypothetical protein
MDTTTYIYDGEGYYVTISDSFTVTDELEEVYTWIPSVSVTSSAVIHDLFDFDIIVNIEEDPGYIVAQSSAVFLDYLNTLKTFVVDNLGNFVGVSEKFLWKVSPIGTPISQTFLFPNCEGVIIDCKWYNGKLYILHNLVIPREDYHIINEFVGVWDKVTINGQVYGVYAPTYEYLHPIDGYQKVILPEYSAFRTSVYTIDGKLERYFDILSGDPTVHTGEKLLSPVSIDIYEDIIYILDKGDASLKKYSLFGVYQGHAITSNLLFSPLQIFVENENYFWVVDMIEITTTGYTHVIKRVDAQYGSIELEHKYNQKPYMAFSISNNIMDTYVIEREGTKYKMYKNFVYQEALSNKINGHYIQLFRGFESKYFYIFNNEPIDIRGINLNTATEFNLRECTKPVTVQDIAVENNLAILSDTGLQEVGFYHFFGQRGDVILSHIVPKGIVKVGDTYYVTDIRNNVLYKIHNSTVTRISNRDFVRPFDLTTDGEYLYVVDSGKNMILKLDLNGVTVSTIGSPGKFDGEFTYPVSIAINEGLLYVLDAGNFRVQTFTLSGEFQQSFVLSPPVDPIIIYREQVIHINGDIDDAYETTSGQCVIWGDLKLSSNYGRLFALRFPVCFGTNSIEFLSATISINSSTNTTYSSNTYTIQFEDTINAAAYQQITGADLLNRVKVPLSLQKTWTVPYSGSPNTTPDLSDVFQYLISAVGWSPISTHYVSMIAVSNVNTPSLKTFTANTAVLNIKYNEIIPLRRQGIFFHMIVDDNYFYVSDISAKKINMYNKLTGILEDSYPFYGTIMEKLSEDVFITNKNCAISFIDKYAWEQNKLYTLEFDSDSETLLYTFEPTWETQEVLETFEQDFSTDFIETFEWFGEITFDQQEEVEFELSIPDIVWRL